jgi:hypothetical protein
LIRQHISQQLYASEPRASAALNAKRGCRAPPKVPTAQNLAQQEVIAKGM